MVRRSRGRLARLVVAGVAAACGLASAAPQSGWTGVALRPMGWIGLGLYDVVWAAWRGPVQASQPAGAPPGAADTRRIWERIEYPTPMTDLGPAYRSYVALVGIDCQNGVATVLQWTTYAGNNLAGGVAATAYDPGKPAYIVPGSIDDALRKVACAGR